MMASRLRCLFVAAATVAAIPPPATAAEEALLPASVFYRPADLADVKLSPSGDLLGVRTGAPNGRTGLYVINLREPAKSAVVARFADADVDEFHWVGNRRLVFDLVDTRSGGGDQRMAPGLLSVGADGTDLRLLVKLNNPAVAEMRTLGREPLPYNHKLLHVPTNQVEGEEHVIVGEIRFDARYEVSEIVAKRLNIVSGQARSLSFGLPERVFTWHFDTAGEARVVEAVRNGRKLVHHRAPASEQWQQIADFDSLRQAWSVHGVDGDTMYVRRGDRRLGTEVLARFDLREKRLHAEAFVSTPGFDFRGRLVRENDGGPVLGVRVVTDAQTTTWFEPQMKAIQAAVDAKLPGRINVLTCRRCLEADPVALVRSYSDTDPGSWWVYRHAKGEWNPVGAVRRDIDPRRMATLDLHRFKARDGLEVPVWLTVPRGVKRSPGQPAMAAPAVVLVHGGPFVRGYEWGWHPLEQFLASRGYVVIAPEFRGSRGYGDRLHRAGWKQWGSGMIDDVADALKWAAQQGWVNPERACIAGASYGGYASLMGAIRYPELYRCSVAWVAVTDPLLLYADIWNSDFTRESRRFYLPQMMGDPVTDAEMLKASSPLQQASRLTRPVLLAMGGSDRRVPIDHGERLNQAMRAAGLPLQYVVYPGEAHGWLTQETRRDFHERMEKFLAEHLR